MYLSLRKYLTALPAWLVVPAYAVVHGVLVWCGVQAVFNPQFLAPFWPASGALLAILLLQPSRRWPMWILGAFLGHTAFAALPVRGDLSPVVVAFAATGMLAPWLGAILVRRLVPRGQFRERPLTTLGVLFLATVVAPVLPGYLSAQISMLLGSSTPVFLIWRTWWSAEALGMIAVTPLVLAWSTEPGLRWLQDRWRAVEILLTTAALLVVTLLVCNQPSGFSYTILLVIPFLLWLALRADRQLVAAAGLASLSIAVFCTLQGNGPFITGPLSDEFSALGLNALYMVLIPTALAMASLVDHRRVLLARFQLAELLVELLTYLVDSTPEELDERIHESLRAVGQFIGADRAKLLLFEGGTIQVFSGWTRPGAIDNDDRLNGQPMAHFPWVIDELAAGRAVSFDSADLPDAISDAERRRYAALDAETFRVLPILEGNALRGAVALAWISGQPYMEAERLTLLPAATQLFASGLRRARVQDELDAYQDSLRLLASELSLAEERVRRATAVDLHDSIGQSLAVARIKLGQLLQERSDDVLLQLREILDEAIGHTRHMIADLSPPVLYELGLTQAMRWLADRERRRGDFRFEIAETGTPGNLSEESKVAIFQCYRELLTNVVKHAHAGSVQITVAWLDEHVEVTVSDDGVGFSTASNLGPTPAGGHFGLFSVRERLQSLDGHFSMESTRGLGTRARISVPLKRERIAV